jgi:DnaJ-domain-containing protein 1
MNNYFVLLGLEEKFDLHADAINRQYFAAQKKHYPDRRTGDMRQSLLLNEAYLTLLDPLARAQHLFELNGIDIASSVLDLKSLTQMTEQANTLDSAIAKLRSAFLKNDLNQAYTAWCECQYVKRLRNYSLDF